MTIRRVACGLALALCFGGATSLPAAPPDGTRPAIPPPTEVLTLGQAITLALSGNRDLKNAALEAAKADDEVHATRAQGLPQFNIYATATQMLEDAVVKVPGGAFGTFTGIGPIPATDTEVVTPAGRQNFVLGQVAQPLTQLRSVSLGTQLKRANLEIAREQLRDKQRAVVNDLRRVYYGLLRSQSGLVAAEETIASLRELNRVVEERMGQKVELPAAGMDVRARLARAEYDALTLRNDLLSGSERLNDLLGRPIDISFSVDPVPDIAPYEADLEAARSAALAKRADLKELRLRQKMAELDHKMKKWDFVPEVSFNYTYIALPAVDLVPERFQSLGFVLSWEVFDWGRRRRELAVANKSLEQSGNMLREAEAQAAIDIGLKYRDLQRARSLLEATRLAQEAAREQLKVTTERYAQKAALLRDVLESQEKLAAANRQRDEALLAAWTARSDLEKALGED
ncbi:MAG TPA: TolC family protein [Candidatus Polarisedimenticolia bacterium]|nr:TolC family protein [Candidatus Polarisedimenticolia bacterium]